MRRTKEDAARTREAILDAAEHLFFEHGVAGTTLAQIAAAADLTRGAIYWHFENKLDLFRAMQDRARLPQEEFLSAASHGEPPTICELLENTLAALRFLRTDRRTQRVLTILMFRCEYVGEMQAALYRRDRVDELMHTGVARIFEVALARRACTVARENAHQIAMAYVCSVKGLVTEWLRSDGCFDLVAVGEQHLRMIVGDHGMGPARGADCAPKSRAQVIFAPPREVPD